MLSPNRESSDDVVAAKRVTDRNLAAAWSLALVVFFGFAVVSVADVVCACRTSAANVGAAAPSSREPAPPG